MQHIADLLARLPLPDPEAGGTTGGGGREAAVRSPCDDDLVHELGADLPAGHVHVWGGPDGAGKTAFLLCLAQQAAAQGRRVVYATYDLAPESLALRLLAMHAGVDLAALPDPDGKAETCRLKGRDLLRAHAARGALSKLPLEILPARGFSARSLWDRLVRRPFRADVLAIDYLQGVVREPGSPLASALQELTGMAEQLHVAVVCAVRPGDATCDDAATELERLRKEGAAAPERIGWLAPCEEAGRRRAEVLHNRYGTKAAVPLDFDEASGAMGRAEA